MNRIAKYEEELSMEDHISRLPESVIHYIFSFLPFKQIVITSTLSKTWNRIWFSFPSVDLFINTSNYDDVNRIMDLCLIRKVRIQKLQLTISVYNSDLSSSLDLWLIAAVERKVSEIVIKMCIWPKSEDFQSMYSVPREIIRADAIKLLHIEECVIGDRFSCVELSLPRLRELKLNRCVFVGEEMLSEVLSGCPELLCLEVVACENVGKVVSVSRKPFFRYFYLSSARDVERIEILTPSLETFKCSMMTPCVMELDSCVVLKRLDLSFVYLSKDCLDLQRLLAKLVCVEELELQDCRVAEKIRISSSSLRKLVISYYRVFPGAEINIPSLASLEFYCTGGCNSNSHLSSWNVPNVDKIHMAFSALSLQTICRGLKCFVEKSRCYEDLRLLIECRDERNYIMHEKLHTVPFSSLKKFVKRAKPQCIVISSLRDQNFLTRMLISRKDDPVNLSLISSSRQNIKLLYEKLRNATMTKQWFWNLQLVSTEGIEREMSSACRGFVKTLSTGFETATIILHKKTLKEWLVS